MFSPQVLRLLGSTCVLLGAFSLTIHQLVRILQIGLGEPGQELRQLVAVALAIGYIVLGGVLLKLSEGTPKSNP